MGERPLAPLAAVAGLACCVGTALAAVALGGVALASLGRFGVVSGLSLVLIVTVAWSIDLRHTTTPPTSESDDLFQEIR